MNSIHILVALLVICGGFYLFRKFQYQKTVIELEPDSIKIIILEQKSHTQLIQVFFQEKGSPELENLSFPRTNCKLLLSAEYNLNPKFQIVTNGLMELCDVKICLPEGTKFEHSS